MGTLLRNAHPLPRYTLGELLPPKAVQRSRFLVDPRLRRHSLGVATLSD